MHTKNETATGDKNIDGLLDAHDMHREAQASAASAIASLGDALEELAFLAAELAMADHGPLEVNAEDLEGEGPDAMRRRCHAAQCLTLAAKIAHARSQARAARTGEEEAAWVAGNVRKDLERATTKQ